MFFDLGSKRFVPEYFLPERHGVYAVVSPRVMAQILAHTESVEKLACGIKVVTSQWMPEDKMYVVNGERVTILGLG